MIKDVHYIEVDITELLNKKTSEDLLAWDDLINNYSLQYCKGGRYPLTKYWMGYCSDPYENLILEKKDWNEKWEYQGMLGKVIADYILKERPSFNDWESVLISVDW